jgi:hypothetical protein
MPEEDRLSAKKRTKSTLMIGAEVSVGWGYDVLVTIVLTPRNWRRVKSGKALSIRGKGYHYEGEFFWDYWQFNGLGEELVVEYGNGGSGYCGPLSGAYIVEGRYQAGVIKWRRPLPPRI